MINHKTMGEQRRRSASALQERLRKDNHRQQDDDSPFFQQNANASSRQQFYCSSENLTTSTSSLNTHVQNTARAANTNHMTHVPKITPSATLFPLTKVAPSLPSSSLMSASHSIYQHNIMKQADDSRREDTIMKTKDDSSYQDSTRKPKKGSTSDQDSIIKRQSGFAYHYQDAAMENDSSYQGNIMKGQNHNHSSCLDSGRIMNMKTTHDCSYQDATSSQMNDSTSYWGTIMKMQNDCTSDQDSIIKRQSDLAYHYQDATMMKEEHSRFRKTTSASSYENTNETKNSDSNMMESSPLMDLRESRNIDAIATPDHAGEGKNSPSCSRVFDSSKNLLTSPMLQLLVLEGKGGQSKELLMTRERQNEEQNINVTGSTGIPLRMMSRSDSDIRMQVMQLQLPLSLSNSPTSTSVVVASDRLNTMERRSPVISPPRSRTPRDDLQGRAFEHKKAEAKVKSIVSTDAGQKDREEMESRQAAIPLSLSQPAVAAASSLASSVLLRETGRWKSQTPAGSKKQPVVNSTKPHRHCRLARSLSRPARFVAAAACVQIAGGIHQQQKDDQNAHEEASGKRIDAPLVGSGSRKDIVEDSEGSNLVPIREDKAVVGDMKMAAASTLRVDSTHVVATGGGVEEGTKPVVPTGGEGETKLAEGGTHVVATGGGIETEASTRTAIETAKSSTSSSQDIRKAKSETGGRDEGLEVKSDMGGTQSQLLEAKGDSSNSHQAIEEKGDATTHVKAISGGGSASSTSSVTASMHHKQPAAAATSDSGHQIEQNSASSTSEIAEVDEGGGQAADGHGVMGEKKLSSPSSNNAAEDSEYSSSQHKATVGGSSSAAEHLVVDSDAAGSSFTGEGGSSTVPDVLSSCRGEEVPPENLRARKQLTEFFQNYKRMSTRKSFNIEDVTHKLTRAHFQGKDHEALVTCVGNPREFASAASDDSAQSPDLSQCFLSASSVCLLGIGGGGDVWTPRAGGRAGPKPQCEEVAVKHVRFSKGSDAMKESCYALYASSVESLRLYVAETHESVEFSKKPRGGMSRAAAALEAIGV
ncbi:unnamed protein product [Amoebophrya sp. A25]|nr:unnamed protein product [Amoebophrya sp. A25]|eukprot:GSA25T00002868001.1